MLSAMRFNQSSEIIAATQNLLPSTFDRESIGVSHNEIKRNVFMRLIITDCVSDQNMHQLVSLLWRKCPLRMTGDTRYRCEASVFLLSGVIPVLG